MSCLEGKRISLRPIERADLESLNCWKNKEDIYMFLGGGYQPVSKDQQEKWMESVIDLTGNNKRFMITENKNPVGMVELNNIHWIHRTCEIGIFIGEEQARGKGVASEACELIEQYGKKYLNLRKITLKAVAENKKAVLMWLSLGYEKVGELKEECFINGKYCDLLIMEKFLKNTGGYSASRIISQYANVRAAA